MKRKAGKKILSTILAAVMLAAAIPAMGASAAAAALSDAASGWTSDTNSDLTVQPGKTYQFKFTAANPDAIQVWMGTPGVFSIAKSGQESGAVYYKITAVGTPGAAAGVYVSYNGGSGTKLCVATVAGGTGSTSAPSAPSSGWTSDTNGDLSLEQGKTYQFKFMAPNPGGINVWMGTPGVFSVTKTSTEADAVYYRITAIGAPGSSAGLYVSYNGGSGTKLCVATVAGSSSSGSASSGSGSGAADSSGLTDRQKAAVASGLTLGSYHHGYEQEIFDLTNAEREKAGLPAYVWAKSLTEMAQTRARELAEQFSHTRPNDAPMQWENIAMSNIWYWTRDEATNESVMRIKQTPENAVQAWMDSSGHRANILNEDAVAMAVGYYVAEDGTVYCVQCFSSSTQDLINPTMTSPLL